MWSGTYEEIRVDRMSMKYSWLCSRYNLYCDYYNADRSDCAEYYSMSKVNTLKGDGA